MRWPPLPAGAELGEAGERLRDGSEVAAVAAVVREKAKHAPQLAEVNGRWYLGDGRDFGLVGRLAIPADVVSQVLHALSGEHALVRVGLKPMVVEGPKYPLHVCHVFGRRVAGDDDVVDKAARAAHAIACVETGVHRALEEYGRALEAKRHARELVECAVVPKRCFCLVLLGDGYLVKPRAQVQFCIYLFGPQPFEEFVGVGEGVLLSQGCCVEAPEVVAAA